MSSKRIVLVVDDDVAVLETLQLVLLSRTEFHILSSAGFTDASAQLSGSPRVDVLIADVILRNAGTGIELCHLAIGLNANTAIVLISAEGPSEIGPYPSRAIFLRKPFGKAELLNAIDKASSSFPANA